MKPRWAATNCGVTVFALLLAACSEGNDLGPVPTLELGEPTISGRVAMPLFGPGPSSEVWLVDADGQNLAPVEEGVSTWQPRFSRDGTRIAYVSLAHGLTVLDLVSNTRQRVAFDGSRPTWSPNGDRLAWVDTAERIHVRELATGATAMVWRSSDRIAAIEWSPTQDVIAIAWEGRGQVSGFGLDLGLMPASGGFPRTISGWFSDARWSPDGKMLGAARGLIDVHGREVVGGDRVVPLAWSADGKGQLRIGSSPDGLRFVLQDLRGVTLMVLPLPPDRQLPMLIDYGYFWADWSWD